MRHRSLRVCLALPLVLICSTVAWAGEVVVPNASGGAEGASMNAYPFHLAAFSDFGIDTMRYQQVYSAEEFDSLGGPVLITEIRFRPDGDFGAAFSGTLPDIQICLSTTAFTPDGLSSTFDDNVGPNETVVHDGELFLSSSYTGWGPKDFDIVIPLSTPFPYDPGQGNLLLDVRNFGGGSSTFFDAVSTAGDPVSRAFTTMVGDVTSPTADFADSGGLVTQFAYTSDEAPPPTSLLVAIDIKPGEDENQVNLNSNGNGKGNGKGKGKAKGAAKGNGKAASTGPVLSVAILTTDHFDATLTDVSTVLLGDPLLGGTAPAVRSTMEDVDGDGDLDVLLHFSLGEMQDANAISAESLVLVLTGQTIDGIAIDGMDFVNVKSK